METLSVLVVGAGAVGQVFGHRLARGGASVTFFVREKYRASTAHGFAMWPLNGTRREPVCQRFTDFRVIASVREVAATRFDQVYLTVPSPAVREPWLAPFLAAVGDATVVALQPSREDYEAVLAAGGSRQAVLAGSIGLVSYATPLAGQTRYASPGTAYWFPPLLQSLVSGAPQRVRSVVTSLLAGGLPARAVADVHHTMAFPNAHGMTFLTGLEAAGWSVRRLREGPLLALTCAAMREVIPIVELAEGSAPLGVSALAAELPLLAGLWVGERIAPFPLEPYLEKHFTKVGAQTRLITCALRTRGRASGLPVTALERLEQSLGPKTAHPS